ncbi:MAG: 3-oxoacyl-[acyl-carrier-protein] reductase [Sphingobacteriia bacterium]|nr:3-oxoacyl-[acyl-carrier-protein] reductase [Sphingobacteriia bacterium]
MKLLSGKTALITGASRGIGKAIALEFARQGANIAFTDLGDESQLAGLESLLQAEGVQAKGFVANAAAFEPAQQVVKEVLATFSGLDIVVNNAGITRDNLLLRMTEEQFDLVLEVNLKSVFNYTKAAIGPMMKQRKGCFINVSSVVGVDGNAGQANYAASKAGIVGFTQSVAKELGSRNIRANAIAPGFIMTEMTQQIPEVEIENWLKSIPLQRPGTVDDVAQVCVFLASDMASYVTGQVIHIDGGMKM